jgi:cytochrome P450
MNTLRDLLPAKDTLLRALIAGARPGPASGAPPVLKTRLPAVGEGLAMLIDPVNFQRACHEALGDVFALSIFGVPLVLAQGPEAIARFSAASDDELDLITAYQKLLGKLLGEELFQRIPPAMLRELSGQSVRKRSAALARDAASFLGDKLGSAPAELDAMRLCSELVLEMTCRFVCGDTLSRERIVEIASLFEVLESDYSVVGLFLPIETPALRRRVQARERLIAVFEDEIRRAVRDLDRLEDGYLRTVIDAMLGPEPASAAPAQLRAAAVAIMGVVFGAHTNTANSLALAWLDVLERPALARSLDEERRSVLADGKPLDLSALCAMPALLRAINESMRMKGGGVLWRYTHKSYRIGPYEVPAKSFVGISMSLLHQDQAVYPAPAQYRPERYAAMVTDDFQSPPLKDKTYGVWGVGKHVCPGRGLAYTIIASALTVLLDRYTVRVKSAPRRWHPLVTAGIARPIGQFRVAVAPRAPS